MTLLGQPSEGRMEMCSHSQDGPLENDSKFIHCNDGTAGNAAWIREQTVVRRMGSDLGQLPGS